MKRFLGRVGVTTAVWAATAALGYFLLFYLELLPEIMIVVIIVAIYAVRVTTKIWSQGWPSN